MLFSEFKKVEIGSISICIKVCWSFNKYETRFQLDTCTKIEKPKSRNKQKNKILFDCSTVKKNRHNFKTAQVFCFYYI